MTTKSSRNFKTDYINQVPEISTFLSGFPNLDSFKAAIKKRNQFPQEKRELLYKHLIQSYSEVNTKEKVLQNISLLKKENTFVLCTGHQLCLGLGPLYTTYKILTIIKLSEYLNTTLPEYNFIPVFWMASEDHDLDEINHFYSDFKTKHTYLFSEEGASGRVTVDSSLESFWPSVYPEDWKHFFKSGIQYGTAFFEFINHLFSKYGLVILNADDSTLKRSFLPVLKEEILIQKSAKSLNIGTELVSEYYNPQANVRDINLFYFNNEKRERLTFKNNFYQLTDSGRTFSQIEILDELEAHPERFSPNALLRPLYQEWILPGICYCGGWAELSYWIQCRELFNTYNIPFPVLLPRISASLIRPNENKLLASLGLNPDTLSKETAELQKIILNQLWQDELIDSIPDKLSNFMQPLKDYYGKIDHSLVNLLDGEEQKILNFVSRFKEKVMKQAKNKFGSKMEDLNQVKKKVQPDFTQQERILSLLAFNDYKPENLIHFIYEKSSILEYKTQWITLPENP